MLVVALDVGTSSARARVFDAAGRAQAGAEGHVAYEPTTSADGGVELHPGALMEAVAGALDRCLAGAGARAGDIAAVGVSVFWHSLLALDGDGRPLTPVITWADTRAAAAALALRREHADRRRLGALALACAGTALVLLGGGGSGSFETVGVAMALTAAVAYSVYILVADTVVSKLDPFLMSALITTGGAVTFWTAGVVHGGLDLTLSSHGWLDIAGIVLVSTVLPVSTFLFGLERVGPSTASILSCFEPVVTVSLAMALYGERLGPGQLAGGALVLAAVVLLQAKVRRNVATAEAAGPAPARALARDVA